MSSLSRVSGFPAVVHRVSREGGLNAVTAFSPILPTSQLCLYGRWWGGENYENGVRCWGVGGSEWARHLIAGKKMTRVITVPNPHGRAQTVIAYKPWLCEVDE
jgi:hypothetical protein